MFYFRLPPRLTDAIVTGFTCLMDGTVYILGPILIGFALVIASGLSYSFFYVVLPMMQRAYSKSPYLHLILACHVAYVVLVLSNVLYNYFLCVVTSNKGANYERVVRELADATDFWYPDTPSEVRDYEQEYREKMLLRMERRQARAREAEANTINNNSNAVSSSTNDNNNNNNNMTHRKTAATANSNNTNTSETSSTTAPRPRVWTLMGPYEWGFCSYSKQPKPPRSHYDHVTKTLVLNMDHYCPW
jgi:palmitoyltransferase